MKYVNTWTVIVVDMDRVVFRKGKISRENEPPIRDPNVGTLYN